MTDIRQDDMRAGAVITRIRSFLQRHEIERQPVDLNQLVADGLRLVRSDAEIRKMRLSFEPEEMIPPILGDRIQLQQVLLNLLLNAMDALNETPPDNRRITLCVRAANGEVEVAVTDNGPGIPVDKLAHLFEPFFTTKAKGLGMGLSISRNIVEAHGGRLRAENNPGRGATFSFSLPAAG